MVYFTYINIFSGEDVNDVFSSLFMVVYVTVTENYEHKFKKENTWWLEDTWLYEINFQVKNNVLLARYTYS